MKAIAIAVSEAGIRGFVGGRPEQGAVGAARARWRDGSGAAC
ncbi:hypothetical protein ACPWT1_07210 [Ramlibacter sp. MMS24-I3-19]